MAFQRDAAGLGQALAYIRPLQKDLDTLENQSTEQVSGYKTSLNETTAPWILVEWVVVEGGGGLPPWK